jgi:hypothetical protein
MILSRICVCDYKRGLDCSMDLLTTVEHHGELQVNTALSLISTTHKPLAHAKSSQFSIDLSWQRLITVEILQLQALMPLPAGHLLAAELFSTVNSTMAPSLLNLRCIVRLNSQHSADWVPGWRPFHTTLLVFSSLTSFQLTTELLLCRHGVLAM